MEIPFSAACERNKDPILEVITPYLSDVETVLEIGSGTGQHAIYFSQNLPHLIWQTSDQAHYLDGIVAQIDNKIAQPENKLLLKNLAYPIQLDVTQDQWLKEKSTFDVIYSANTLHIMPWQAVEAFFVHLHQVLNRVSQTSAKVIIYGPFKYAGEYTSEGNHSFDQDLKSRGCGSGIRDFEAVNQLAINAGLRLVKDIAMPANNQCLVWELIR